jgi:hypothetical protein
VECVGDEMVQPRGWGGRGWCRGRGDVRARKEVGDEASTQLGCGFVSMIRVASTRTLQQEREKVSGLKFGKALAYRCGSVGCGRRGGPRNFLGLSEGRRVSCGDETG